MLFPDLNTVVETHPDKSVQVFCLIASDSVTYPLTVAHVTAGWHVPGALVSN